MRVPTTYLRYTGPGTTARPRNVLISALVSVSLLDPPLFAECPVSRVSLIPQSGHSFARCLSLNPREGLCASLHLFSSTRRKDSAPRYFLFFNPRKGLCASLLLLSQPAGRTLRLVTPLFLNPAGRTLLLVMPLSLNPREGLFASLCLSLNPREGLFASLCLFNPAGRREVTRRRDLSRTSRTLKRLSGTSRTVSEQEQRPPGQSQSRSRGLPAPLKRLLRLLSTVKEAPEAPRDLPNSRREASPGPPEQQKRGSQSPETSERAESTVLTVLTRKSRKYSFNSFDES